MITKVWHEWNIYVMKVNSVSNNTTSELHMADLSILKQWIKGNAGNFICKTRSVSKQEVLSIITYPSNVLQWPETMLFKLATFPYIHWIVLETLLSNHNQLTLRHKCWYLIVVHTGNKWKLREKIGNMQSNFKTLVTSNPI